MGSCHYLKHAFQTHGIQQKALAMYLGMTEARVSQMLNGTPGPTLETETLMVKFLFNVLDLKNDAEVSINGVSNTK